MELYEMKQGIARSLDKLESIGKSLDLEGKKNQVEKNNAMMAEPDFWHDQKKAQKLIRETNSMKTPIDGQESIVIELNDLNERVADISTNFEDDNKELNKEEYVETKKKYED